MSVLAVFLMNTMPLRAGDGAADDDHVQFGIDLDDVKVLHRDLLGAHVTGADLAGKDAAGIRGGAHGAGMTVDRAAAVGHRGALGAPALDDAGVALALADAGDVDLVALFEGVSLDNVADVHLVGILEAELVQHAQRADAGLVEMTLFGFVELALGDFLEAELDGSIAFLFRGLLLDHFARAGFDNGHGDDLAGLVEDLRHADLLADDGLFHWIAPFRLLVRSHGSYRPEAPDLTLPS